MKEKPSYHDYLCFYNNVTGQCMEDHYINVTFKYFGSMLRELSQSILHTACNSFFLSFYFYLLIC